MTSEELDQYQYTPEGIRDYERVWGEGFVSPGGAQLAREFIGKLQLPPGALVMDVGCGLGGGAFLMAQEFDYQVEGIDLSRNMIARAQDRCRALGLSNQVRLFWQDACRLDSPARYDAILSRDAFLHIKDKEVLFSSLWRALKPGGYLHFTDYCCSIPPWSDSFQAYLKQHQYTLHTLNEYRDLLEGAGFEEVTATDLTERFVQTLIDDLAHLGTLKDQEFLTQGWLDKLARARQGEQRWGHFCARRPAG